MLPLFAISLHHEHSSVLHRGNLHFTRGNVRPKSNTRNSNIPPAITRDTSLYSIPCTSTDANPQHRIEYCAPEVSRFRPRLYYWVFIPGDLICLVIQAAGGAMSTTSSGASQTGVDLALAGLVLQVVFMLVFCALFADYLIRYARSSRAPAAGGPKFTRRLWVFFGFMGTATLLILVRCAYRLAELHEGYGGELVRDEALFIGLEGV